MPDDINKGRLQKFHGGRSMLNRPGCQTTAAIVAEVEDSSTWANTAAAWVEPRTVLQISDCDRSISFEIDVTGAEAANSLYKVDMLIKLLTAFRAGLALEQKRSKARVERRVP